MNQHASMNRIFRLVWSDALNAYVVAAETSRGRGKRASRRLIGAVLSLAAAVAHAGGPSAGLTGAPSAAPSGGHVTAGSGSITHSGATTTIAQSSETLSLNWQSFNIGAQQTVDFVQPNAAAIAVNRILGSSGSVILGQLNANGQVYLINPNGVLFGRGAEVNVGGLVASTLDLDDSTLGDASKSFSGKGTGSIVNDGTLTAATTAESGGGNGGGAIVLLGNHVSNSGVISAQLGSVALGAGSAATLRFAGSHLVSMQVDKSVLDSMASNGGLIRADGGVVLMTAGAQKSLLASVVNNTGIIEARTLDQHAGTITLLGGMSAGTVDVGGTLDASALAGGNGGSIDTSAAHVQVEAAAKVTTAAAMGLSGSWLIDPTDFTIAAGTAAQSASGIGATTLQGELANGNVSIATSAGGSQAGDINVNAPVSWSANALTLTAANDINVNAVMTVSGTARVNFEPGSGNLAMGFAPDGSFAGRVDISSTAVNALTIGGQVYTVINSLGLDGSTTTTDLQGMNGNLAGFYALGSGIDASASSGFNSGAGFAPIGSLVTSNFTGVFDGLGHTITGLTLSNSAGVNMGLFWGIGSGAVVRNVGLVGASVYGNTNVGALAGANYGTISNVYATAVVTSSQYYVGGLVGQNSGTISNSYATGSVAANAGSYAGGLVAVNNAGGNISNSYATGSVAAAGSYAGGLVGENKNGGNISNSYATGIVSAQAFAGGLVGSNYGTISNSYASGAVGYGTDSGGLAGQTGGAISNSYATGPVGGNLDVGGLVGATSGFGSIANSYASGAVSGQGNVGGLVGFTGYGTTISTSHASGNVTGANSDVGGLVGHNYGAVTSSHASGAASGGGSVGGLVGSNGAAGLPGGSVSDSYATGDATAVEGAGGLAGNNYGTISGSFAMGTATATVGYAGGLVGLNDAQGSVTQSYATGAVTGGELAGGLVGQNYGSISVAFASGPVNGTTNVGGLVGQNTAAGTITNAYATGSVTGSNNVGGLAGSNYGLVDKTYATGIVNIGTYGGSLVGTNQGTVTNSFYNSAVNPSMTGSTNGSFPNADVPGSIVGLTTAQLQTQATFNTGTAVNGGLNPGWDFAGTWMLYAGHTAPLLQAFMTPLVVTGTVTQTYTAGAFAPIISHLTYSIVPDESQLFGTLSVAGTAADGVNVGTYSFTPGGLYSDQLGYLISYNTGTLTITPATLTVSGTRIGSKVYNGTTVATLTGGSLVGLLGGNTLTLTQGGSFASKNVGTGIAVTASDSIGGASAGDYVLVDPTGLVGTITPALLTVSGTTVGSKVYDDSTLAQLSGGSLVGVIGGDSVALNQSGVFASAGVGTGIPVTATDSLSGASAGDYSIVEPTGLRGSILPASPGTPTPTPAPAPVSSSALVPAAALNASTQIVENFIYPQWGAEPQVINPSTTIAAVGAPADELNADATGSQPTIAINVSMTIGANGTLKIKDGGLRLPGDASAGH
jgi:filamentous hemagglutinin family protein